MGVYVTNCINELIAGANPDVRSLRINEYTRGNFDTVDPATGEKTTVSSEHRTALFECVESGDFSSAKLLVRSQAIKKIIYDHTFLSDSLR